MCVCDGTSFVTNIVENILAILELPEVNTVYIYSPAVLLHLKTDYRRETALESRRQAWSTPEQCYSQCLQLLQNML